MLRRRQVLGTVWVHFWGNLSCLIQILYQLGQKSFYSLFLKIYSMFGSDHLQNQHKCEPRKCTLVKLSTDNSSELSIKWENFFNIALNL